MIEIEMKKITAILALSAIALSMVSCSSDKDEAIIPQEGEKVHVSFMVSCKQPSATRADMNLSGTGYASMVWMTGDEIGVSSDAKIHVDPILVKVSPESTNTDMATAEGDVDYTPEGYYCVYPKKAFKSKVDKNTAIIEIPNYQNIDKGFSICQEAFLQVGYTKKGSNWIDMKTPCSFLVFNTGDHDNIDYVKVRAFKNDKEYSIAGAISVYKTETSGFSQASGNIIDANYDAYHEVNCYYNLGEAFPVRHNFAIAVRPGTPDMLEVDVFYNDKAEPDTYRTSIMVQDGKEYPLEFVNAMYHNFPPF